LSDYKRARYLKRFAGLRQFSDVLLKKASANAEEAHTSPAGRMFFLGILNKGGKV